MDQQQPVVTEDQYNATMAAAYRGQGNQEADPVELPPPAAMPEGGVDKFYNKQTGEYNWAAHAREAEYRLGQYRNQTQEPDPTQQQYEDQQQNTGVQQPWERAGLNPSLTPAPNSSLPLKYVTLLMIFGSQLHSGRRL